MGGFICGDFCLDFAFYFVCVSVCCVVLMFGVSLLGFTYLVC